MINNFSTRQKSGKTATQTALYPAPQSGEGLQYSQPIADDLAAQTPDAHPTQRGRVAIFVDAADLFHAAADLKIEIDYTRLLSQFVGGDRLFRAYFYTGCDRANEKQQGFLLWMRRNGYRVIAKDLYQFADGSRKANLDVEIAVDMLTLAKYCNTQVLISGNGELTYVVNAVGYQGVRVEVVSLRSMTSESLINVADHYIDLETIKHHIQKPIRNHSCGNY